MIREVDVACTKGGDAPSGGGFLGLAEAQADG